MTARFQSFDDTADRAASGPRIATLRAELARRGLDGFIVPRADRFQNEYVPPSDERLSWLTGFSGSAGTAIVLADRAALFVDGRYTLQAREQVDTGQFEIVQVTETPPHQWIETTLREGQKLGYDPWLHTVEGAERLAKACAAVGASLVPAEPNPVDAVWADRPPAPLGAVVTHEQKFAGEPADSVRDILAGLADIREPGAFESDLKALGAAHRNVRLDAAGAADAIARLVAAGGGKVRRGPDPIALMKAVKNATEVAGARTAHRRDGAAVTRFLAWLDREAPAGRLTEIDAVEALEDFRRDTGVLKDISFPTISGFGPNGAIVHYRVTTRTNRVIAPDGIFLIDSGAQYEDGTTDITRTVATGQPSEEMRDRFTRVLKGHIAISRAIFPEGTTGAQLDSFARAHLWAAGLDFDHGTGHGVGSYLSVHEGPARISKLGTTALKPGMILSNEPGYYKAGTYGIRIENLVLVVEAPAVAGAEKPLRAFETLTLAPIDRRLIAPAAMTPDEIAWLDRYHADVRAELSPQLDDATRAWLARATAPLV